MTDDFGSDTEPVAGANAGYVPCLEEAAALAGPAEDANAVAGDEVGRVPDETAAASLSDDDDAYALAGSEVGFVAKPCSEDVPDCAGSFAWGGTAGVGTRVFGTDGTGYIELNPTHHSVLGGEDYWNASQGFQLLDPTLLANLGAGELLVNFDISNLANPHAGVDVSYGFGCGAVLASDYTLFSFTFAAGSGYAVVGYIPELGKANLSTDLDCVDFDASGATSLRVRLEEVGGLMHASVDLGGATAEADCAAGTYLAIDDISLFQTEHAATSTNYGTRLTVSDIHRFDLLGNEPCGLLDGFDRVLSDEWGTLDGCPCCDTFDDFNRVVAPSSWGTASGGRTYSQSLVGPLTASVDGTEGVVTFTPPTSALGSSGLLRETVSSGPWTDDEWTMQTRFEVTYDDYAYDAGGGQIDLVTGDLRWVFLRSALDRGSLVIHPDIENGWGYEFPAGVGFGAVPDSIGWGPGFYLAEWIHHTGGGSIDEFRVWPDGAGRPPIATATTAGAPSAGYLNSPTTFGVWTGFSYSTSGTYHGIAPRTDTIKWDYIEFCPTF